MYNDHQYDAALDFINSSNDNVTNAKDLLRIQCYDLYENIYRNSTANLKLVLRGDDQSPILMPNGRKIIEATTRFLGINVGYLVEAQGDEGTQQQVSDYWKDLWKREDFATKFASNKRWGLVRGDFAFLVYATPGKVAGRRISIRELDPRTVFEIENDPNDAFHVTGYHIVDKVQDLREPDKLDKMVARRRTFRQVWDDNGSPTGVTSELTFWEIGKWDDRDPASEKKMEAVKGPFAELEEQEFYLEQSIVHLPVYKWSNLRAQNSTWGTSQLAGLETLLYSINQSLSDEDATMVFQGLGMYVTDASPPVENDGSIGDWNIGPKQIIEISTGQKFDRVTGVTDVTPFQEHMNYVNDGMAEASGTPQTAIGRVDVSVAQSGISLKLELMPLLAANAEKELELVNVLDTMFNDITTMWLPAYEPEQFGNTDVMAQMSVVCVFDDPMPRDHDAAVTEIVTLTTANLILNSMAVAALRDLGWKYPTTDPYTGEPLTDDMIAAMLLNQQALAAQAQDPFASAGGATDAQGNPVDSNGNPVDQAAGQASDSQTIDLGQT